MSTDPNVKSSSMADVEIIIVLILFATASAALIAAGSIVLSALLTG